MKPKAFRLYVDNIEIFNELTDEEAGQLLKALMYYVDTGKIADMSRVVKFNFLHLKQQIDREFANYEEVCEKRSAAGKKGAQAKQANAEIDTNETSKTSKCLNETSKTSKCLEKENEEENEEENEKEEEDILPKPLKGQEDALFDSFWQKYPKKVDKQNAIKAFKRLKVSDEMLESMICSLEKQKKSEQWQRDGGAFIPYPSTWLNGRRWEDETVCISDLKRSKALEYVTHEYDNAFYHGKKESAIKAMEGFDG